MSVRLVSAASSIPRQPVISANSVEEENFLASIRAGVIGSGFTINTPFGEKPLRYFDFIASGRFHRVVEDELVEVVLPYMANTHTETNYTGRLMTHFYENSFKRIAGYINASPDDVLIPVGAGSTAVINRLINVLGIRCPDQLDAYLHASKTVPPECRPVVFLSKMEHHSNDISWRETIADVEYIEFNEHGVVDLDDLRAKLERYKSRPWKIGTFSAASNITGIRNDCHAIARILHEYGASAFFDYAAAGPYVEIDMHPKDDLGSSFDAIFLSVHKFLGGPRTPGVLVANKSLFTSSVPTEPGGGTVLYTSPWDHRFLSSIEARETGGTPPIVQSIQAGLAFDLKATLGVERIERIEQDYLRRAVAEWIERDDVLILGNLDTPRLGVLSIIFKGLHHNLAVALFNDLFGIQVRGGCMCAGPYGHELLNIGQDFSARIRARLDAGHLGEKPGWVRISLSPTVSEEEFQILLEAVDYIATNGKRYESQYELVDATGEWVWRE